MKCALPRSNFEGKIKFCVANTIATEVIMKLDCGDVCPKSGSYKVVDSNGKVVNSVWVGKGETMPPTQYSDCHYEFES